MNESSYFVYINQKKPLRPRTEGDFGNGKADQAMNSTEPMSMKVPGRVSQVRNTGPL